VITVSLYTAGSLQDVRHDMLCPHAVKPEFNQFFLEWRPTKL